MEKDSKDKMEYKNPNTNFKTVWNIDNQGVINQKHFGNQNIDDALEMMKIWEAYYKERNKKLFMVLDVTGLEKASPEANKYLNEKVLSKDSLFARMAIVGGNFFNRTLANMYSKLSNIPMRLFKTTDDATKWVKDGISE